MGGVKGQGTLVGAAFYQFISLSVHVNWIRNSCDMAISKFYIQISMLRSWMVEGFYAKLMIILQN